MSLKPNKQKGTHCYEIGINNLLKVLVLQELQKNRHLRHRNSLL